MTPREIHHQSIHMDTEQHNEGLKVMTTKLHSLGGMPGKTFLLSAALFATSGMALAATDTWLGKTDATWSTAANWTGANTPPISGDDLVFGAVGTQGSTLTDDLASFGVNSLTFNSGAGAFVIGGNAFSLAGNITNNSTVLESLSNAITLTGATTVTTTTGGGNVTLSGVLSSTGSLVKSGAGTLTLSGTNTYTGGLTVNAGTLVAATANGGNGAVGNGNITVNSGGTISVTTANGLWGFSQNLTHTLTINAGGTVNDVSSTGNLSAVVMNGGTLSTTGIADTTYGNWDLNGGVSTLGNGSTSTISGGTVALTETGGTIFAIGAGDTLNVSSVVAHTGQLPGHRAHQERNGHADSRRQCQYLHGQRDGEWRHARDLGVCGLGHGGVARRGRR